MFFYLAKVIWFALQPSALLLLLLFAGLVLLWTRWWRAGRGLALATALLLLLFGLSPLGNAIILPLEDRFPRADLSLRPEPTGFILLGGAEDMLVSAAREAPALNEAGERIAETVMLAQRFPEARIAFAGGAGGVLYQAESEAAGAVNLLTGLGVDRGRLILETRSRDTYENARLLKAELERLGLIGAGKRWLLITSAYHMPRAIGAFRKAGLEVEPWPVDYRTRGSIDFTRPFARASEGLRRIDIAAREWAGLVGYWLRGRTDAFFAAPVKQDAGCDLARPEAQPEQASPCRPSS